MGNKVYEIVTGTEHNAVAEEMQAKAAEMDRQLAAEAAAKEAAENSENGGAET